MDEQTFDTVDDVVAVADYDESISDEIETNEFDESINEETGDAETPDASISDTEAHGEEFEEWEYPEFISDDYVVPESFKNSKEELAWYKEKYISIMDQYRSEEFVEKLKTNYQQVLLEEQEKIERFKAFDDMAKNNPELAIKLYAPQYLATNGIDYKLTDDQMYDYLDKQLAKEFGKNYKQVFDEIDAEDPDTLSGKMKLRQDELMNQLNTMQQNAEQIAQQNTPVPPEVVIEKEYDKFAHAMSKDEYFDMVGEFKNYFTENPIDMKSMYILRNIDDITEEIYQKGLEDGRKETGKTVRTYGREVAHSEPTFSNDDEPFVPINNVYNHIRS